MDTTPATPEPVISTHALAQRLQTLRLKMGWRLEEVADRAGVSRSTLYHLERGTTANPRSATVHRLAEAYGVEVERLIAPIADPVPPHSTRGRSIPVNSSPEWSTEGSRNGTHPGDSLSPACRFDRATNPAVEVVAASDPQLFAGWSPSDWEELYSTFATGGALTDEGVRQVADQINRHRETVHQLRILLHTHLSDVAVGMIETLFRLVCPEVGAGCDDSLPSGVNSDASGGRTSP